MSKIGQQIIKIPAGVTVAIENNIAKITVSKGSLEVKLERT